ncbi:hypothetical protein PanWU01x14_364150 [Parasponia andersonii]|uniref:Uncharacterized protein n=1 Tax=Parasponia andersonii TaxID=3476 RepID=A0A2P5A6E0_PARAD|nr:hypothetical protein PanWU01x14_364150 [Parasponia andersonii]
MEKKADKTGIRVHLKLGAELKSQNEWDQNGNHNMRRNYEEEEEEEEEETYRVEGKSNSLSRNREERQLKKTERAEQSRAELNG